jgi:hypothetical protein
VEFRRAEVPQQNNFCDCGVFLVEYARRFCLHAPAPHLSLRAQDGWPYMMTPDWFRPGDAGEAKRDAIRAEVLSLASGGGGGAGPSGAAASTAPVAAAAAAAAVIELDGAGAAGSDDDVVAADPPPSLRGAAADGDAADDVDAQLTPHDGADGPPPGFVAEDAALPPAGAAAAPEASGAAFGAITSDASMWEAGPLNDGGAAAAAAESPPLPLASPGQVAATVLHAVIS